MHDRQYAAGARRVSRRVNTARNAAALHNAMAEELDDMLDDDDARMGPGDIVAAALRAIRAAGLRLVPA